MTFGLRLTIHTGPVVVGWVGASRLEFTIIGDTVNVTALAGNRQRIRLPVFDKRNDL